MGKPPSLMKLRPWLTIPEAAHYLTLVLDEEVKQADVLRLGLDKRLTISVRFPSSQFAIRLQQEADKQLEKRDVEFLGRGHGVYDLPLTGGEKEELEDEYRQQTEGRKEGVVAGFGIFVDAEDGTRFVLQTRVERVYENQDVSCFSSVNYREATCFPDDAVLVVRTRALQDLVTRVATGSEKPSEELTTRERTTLLTIIAALAREANIDVGKPSKAGETIATIIAAIGYDVAPNTVARHLRRLRATLPARTNDPS